MPLEFKRRTQATIWLVMSMGLAAWLSYVFFQSPDKTVILPGPTTSGHYQIELNCTACHDTTPDGLLVSAVSNKACLECHDQDLENASDSHPLVKFKKPDNRPFLEKIAADKCVTCHTEHRESSTSPMGLTIPPDYCTHCHQTTIDERETHKGLDFQTCATSGCHNYHDNRSLYERHLAVHSLEPPILPDAQVPELDALIRYINSHPESTRQIAGDADAPSTVKADPEHVAQWANSAHAAASVNCSACHQPEGKPWRDEVPMTTCQSCHEGETEGFLMGKHGMRLAAGLTPITPGNARSPMRPEAAHHELSCSSCHGPHAYDTRFAASQACMQCHADEHTAAFSESKHAQLWELEVAGKLPPGSGVSCATCHMPRIRSGSGDDAATTVDHNQNSNLTPNDKMLRNVCQNCHGLPFAIDSLADRNLIGKNFHGTPAKHVPGVDWARDRAISRNDKELLELMKSNSMPATPVSPSNTHNEPTPQK